MHACTVVTRSYLAHARVLARSLQEHHPGSSLHALILDPGPGLRYGQEPFQMLAPEELFTPEEWGPMWFAYTTAELSFATKARLLRHVLDNCGGTATYLDSDIRLYGPISGVEELSQRHAVVLTPHLMGPLPLDGRTPTEYEILQAGAYNTGFLSVGETARPFLDWWWRWLQRQCLYEPRLGLNGDQRWVDLAPTMFDCVVLKDPTLNVAYWNLGGRQLTVSAGRYLVDREPLTFFHFSGFDPHVPWVLSKHSGQAPRALLSENRALCRLCDEYAGELLTAGYDEVRQHLVDQDTLPNGVVLDGRSRRVFREAVAATNPSPWLAKIPNPLTNPGELVEWLREPGQAGDPAWLSRYLRSLYRERPGLMRRYPKVTGRDGARFLAWVRRHADAESIPPVLMPSAGAPRLAGVVPRPIGEGVNVIGCLQGESGVGEAARQLVGAVQALGTPLATYTHSRTYPAARHGYPFLDLRPVPGLLNPYDLNILCINALEARAFTADVGPDFFSGRYTVGYWAWELEECGEYWSNAFDLVDEVWMNSEFAAVGVREATSKPVRVLPIPVRVPVPSPADRSALGLPSGFLFLFVFDYGSGFERKNPDGLVRAFKKAFSPGEGPLLVIKSVRGELYQDKRERLRYEVGGRSDVLLLDEYLSAGDKDALVASCDCYVSLHHSEGFGLTMAEAMALGKPTIATGYSGNLEFMTAQNSFLVQFSPGRVPAGAAPFPEGARWADPDLDHAASLMRYVYENRGAAHRAGERARRDMVHLHGPDARLRLLDQLLGQARSEWGKRKRGEGLAASVGTRSEARSQPRLGGQRRRPVERVSDHPGRVMGMRVPRTKESPERDESRAQPGSPGAGAPPLRVVAPGTGVVLDRERHEELRQAKRDLVWLLRRLERPPLGWLLSRRRGYLKLRRRWLGGG